ncbi:MAG: ABC transporter permease [Bacteroidota bacterium]
MNLFRISWSNLIARPLSVMMSLLLLALGVSIISLLLLVNERLEQNFNQNIKGIDMVVGAKGSPLQLILASVYHIDNPTGNIPLHEAEQLAQHPLVEKAIPMAYGDNYQGYRILGTDSQYVAHYEGNLIEGRLWNAKFEVVLGAAVAKRLGLDMGQTFLGAHGLTDAKNVHDEHPYTVVGILQANGSVIDQLILTGVESVWGIHEEHEEKSSPTPTEETHEEEDHDHEEHADESEEGKEITALLIKFRTPMGMVMLPRMINEETSMQAALPAIEINKLLYKLLPIAINTGQGIAIAIMIISAISVFISLYNNLKDRKYELALMRTMGASRWQLFFIVVMEGLLLALIGAILGLLASRLGLLLLNNMVIDAYHYDFSGWVLLTSEWWLALATMGIGFLAAAFPGIQAFGLNISETLAEG